MAEKVERWHPLTKGLHWLVAILILCSWGSVELHELYEKGDPMRQWWEYLHFSIGLCVLLLVLLRIYWRSTHPRPTPEGGLWQRRLSQLVQSTFYLLMLAMPIAGMAMRQFAGKQTPLFWLFDLPPLVEKNTEIAKQLAFLHKELLWNILLVLLIVHIGAALWHHFVSRNGALRQMLPGVKVD